MINYIYTRIFDIDIITTHTHTGCCQVEVQHSEHSSLVTHTRRITICYICDICLPPLGERAKGHSKMARDASCVVPCACMHHGFQQWRYASQCKCVHVASPGDPRNVALGQSARKS